MQTLNFLPYPSITNWNKRRWLLPDVPDVAGACKRESAVAGKWLVTHKYHGTNLAIKIGADRVVAYGRRNDFLEPSESHYNCRTATKECNFTSLADELFAKYPGAIAVWVYMELYGGGFAGMPSLSSAKLVQTGVYYSNTNVAKAFDVFVQMKQTVKSTEEIVAASAGADGRDGDGDTDVDHHDPKDDDDDDDDTHRRVGVWLPFADMAEACGRANIPVVKLVHESETFQGALDWALEHSADPADTEIGMPLLETSNSGEGTVVRSAFHHMLCKVKNPKFDEIVGFDRKKPRSAPQPKAELSSDILRVVNEARVASVCSKLSEDSLTPKNLAMIAKLVKEDAWADVPPDVQAEITQNKKQAAAFSSACFAASNAFIKSRLTA